MPVVLLLCGELSRGSQSQVSSALTDRDERIFTLLHEFTMVNKLALVCLNELNSGHITMPI